MKIKQTDFVISAVKPQQYPAGALPEIALAGRSNVGKSSLINCLINRKNLARTSSKPGKTQTINFYLLNEAFYFADVPGYGYAKVSKTLRATWVKMIDTYFRKRDLLRAVIHVIDMRHPPLAHDVEMSQFLRQQQIPLIVVATKADKISKGKIKQHLAVIRKGLGLTADDVLLPFSAQTKLGKDELWQEIEQYLHI
jgi:GTP-binding protein